MVAALLRDVLSSEGFEIRVAHSVSEAIKSARDFDPDIAILDINLGFGSTGVDLAFILNEQYPGVAILLLTQHPDLRTAGFDESDLPVGCGFMRKDAVVSTQSIMKAIDELISSKPNAVRGDIDPERPLGELTQTQVEVLRMVAQGYTNQEIANRRNTSIRAVEHVLNAIFLTLGIDSQGGINQRVEAVRRFIGVAGTPQRI